VPTARELSNRVAASALCVLLGGCLWLTSCGTPSQDNGATESRPQPTLAVSEGVQTPDQTEAAAVPGLDYSFDGIAELVTDDGYTVQLHFALTVNGELRSSIADDEPGEASIHAGQPTVSARLVNTTSGRNVPIREFILRGFNVLALYPAQHGVCRIYNPSYVLTEPAGEYCSKAVAYIGCPESETQLPVDGELSCPYQPAWNSEFDFLAVPEGDIEALRDDLSAIEPVFVLTSEANALDESQYECDFGSQLVIASSPDGVTC
jgi:hypothetical protein